MEKEHELPYTGKFWQGKKLTNSVNRELFAKILLTNIHIYSENVFGICIDINLFAKIFLTSSFYLYGSPKFSSAKIFHVRYIVNCLHLASNYVTPSHLRSMEITGQQSL